MDYLKTRAPFWKQVEKQSGKSGGEQSGVEKFWVEAKAADDQAADRWHLPEDEGS
jgi:molybdopterin synthase catalytic subunit